jgi:hypothetical protein
MMNPGDYCNMTVNERDYTLVGYVPATFVLRQ